MLDPFFCKNLDIMLVIMNYALFISHYAGFRTHSKLSNFWVASDSFWLEPLLPLFNFEIVYIFKFPWFCVYSTQEIDVFDQMRHLCTTEEQIPRNIPKKSPIEKIFFFLLS